MSSDDTRGFDIEVSRRLYINHVSEASARNVYGGRGVLTVGQLIERCGLTPYLIYTALRSRGFDWSGIMPVRSSSLQGMPGIICLRRGMCFGFSSDSPTLLWGNGRFLWGDDLTHWSRQPDLAHIARQVTHPLAGEDAYITTVKGEEPWRPELRV